MEVAVEGAKTYFDTNTSNHYHFFCETQASSLILRPPRSASKAFRVRPSMTISRVDVLVRLVDERKR
jgi:Fur family iron response transcriptional regulator